MTLFVENLNYLAFNSWDYIYFWKIVSKYAFETEFIYTVLRNFWIRLKTHDSSQSIIITVWNCTNKSSLDFLKLELSDILTGNNYH